MKISENYFKLKVVLKRLINYQPPHQIPYMMGDELNDSNIYKMGQHNVSHRFKC